MRKIIVENCYQLSILDLKKMNLLPTKDSKPVPKGVRLDWDKNEQRVMLTGILFNPLTEMIYLQCIYPPNGVEHTYTVRLTATPCNFGGVRYWFMCPCYRGGTNGSYCNRKVSKLYLPPGMYEFGCRWCHNLTYADRNISRPDRDGRQIWGSIAHTLTGKRGEAGLQALIQLIETNGEKGTK